MGHQGNPDELVTVQELAVSNAYEIAALLTALERDRLLTQPEGSQCEGTVTEAEYPSPGRHRNSNTSCVAASPSVLLPRS